MLSPKFYMPIVLLFLIYFINIKDFIFYYQGFDLFFIFLFSLFILFKTKQNINRSQLSLFIIFVIIQILISYSKLESILYLYIILSCIIIYNYIYSLENKESLIRYIYILTIINLVATIIHKIGISFNFHSDIFHFFYGYKKNLGGLFQQQNFNALFLNIGMLLSIYYFLKKLNYKYFIIFIIFSYFHISTQSRAGILSFFIIMFIYFFVDKVNSTDRKKVFFMVLTYTFILLLNNLQFNIFSEDISGLLNYQAHNIQACSNSTSIVGRFNIYYSQIKMFLTQPVFGFGFESFKYLNNPFQIDSVETLKLPYESIKFFAFGHNELLQLLVEGGIVVLLVIIYYFYSFFRYLDFSKLKNNYFIFSVTLVIFLQSMFSWQLRYPFFMVIFTVFLAISKEYISSTKININKVNNKIILIIFIPFIIFFLNSIFFESKSFYNVKSLNPYNFSFERLYLATKKPLLNFKASNFLIAKEYKKISKKCPIPKYIDDLKLYDQKYCDNLKNTIYFDKLYELVLTNMTRHRIWFNYTIAAYLSYLKGNFGDMKLFSKKAISLNPNDGNAWIILHFYNILQIAQRSDKSIKELLPKTKVSIDNLFQNINNLTEY